MLGGKKNLTEAEQPVIIWIRLIYLITTASIHLRFLSSSFPLFYIASLQSSTHSLMVVPRMCSAMAQSRTTPNCLCWPLFWHCLPLHMELITLSLSDFWRLFFLLTLALVPVKSALVLSIAIQMFIYIT